MISSSQRKRIAKLVDEDDEFPRCPGCGAIVPTDKRLQTPFTNTLPINIIHFVLCGSCGKVYIPKRKLDNEK